MTVITFITGSAVLLGAYLPNRLFNARVQQKTCQVFCSVRSYWCRHGAISQNCYDVNRNVKPDGATCWQAPAIATFTNEAEAKNYAASCYSFSYACFWDPENRCDYYNDYADVVGTLWTGIVFTVFAVVLALVGVAVAIWYRRRGEYQTV